MICRAIQTAPILLGVQTGFEVYSAELEDDRLQHHHSVIESKAASPGVTGRRGGRVASDDSSPGRTL